MYCLLQAYFPYVSVYELQATDMCVSLLTTLKRQDRQTSCNLVDAASSEYVLRFDIVTSSIALLN